MMDRSKSKQALIQELSLLRQRIEEMGRSESERKKGKDIAASGSADEALRENERIYFELAHFLPQIVFETDMNGTITFVNHAAYAISGYSPEEFEKGLNVLQVLVPEDRDRARSNIQRLLEGKELSNNEYAFLRKDGRTFPVMTETIPIVRNGQIRGLRGFVIDITERKRAEGMLRESIEKYREIFEAITDVFYRTDNDGFLQVVSPSSERLWGYAPEEVVGRKLDDFYVNPEERDRFLSILREKGEVEEFEAVLRAKDGSPVWVSTNARFRRDERGNIVGIQGVTRDVTKRKRAEENLRESEEKYRSLFENANEAIFVVQDGKVVFVNPASSDVLDYPGDQLVSRPFAEFVHPDDRAMVVDNYIKRMKGEEIPPSYSFRIIHRDGTARWAELNAVLMNWEGKPASLNFLSDISDRKRAEEELQRTLESLRRAVGATIQVMVTSVEVRDPYTAGHQLRSVDLARAIAQEMGLPQEKIDGIRMAGSIHDIGKLSVPAELLSKPAKLTAIEFSLIKEHSHKGYEMLKDVKSPWPLAEIVYQHHERMDGSGYPRNLKGDEILMEARIIAVSDVVEAMASHRPYRPALGIPMALEELETNRGILYDISVVDACLKLFREKGYQFPLSSR
jgi:PAS domain S-box-containing protein